jgi:ribosomal protein L37AE/L43A
MPLKPTEREEEFFARKEFEKLQKVEAERQSKLAVEEKKRLKDLHYMSCPKCGMRLVEIDYKGIKIDECSGCEGVWLDAGEIKSVAALEASVLDSFFSIFKK